MGQSYRIRTELGVNKTINVNLDQDFEFLEILSLKIQQTDVYNRNCSEYGVIVGRVTANNGFGVPNARVSVFIPITAIDQSNPLISSIYPYKSPEDKNEDGYRYNLLPYEKSFSAHAATGTFPTRIDALTDSLVVEIYDKYYKFTSKTNESGDYMIMGVPVGFNTLIMDLDLSDIGEFSLTPQDLIRMGLATEAQVAGNRFKTSNDLNSLPQIINLRKDVEVQSLWGDPSVCQIAITRTDFDLRNEANINIQPTSVFMGSIYSSPDKFRVRPPFQVPLTQLEIGGCKPKDNLGNLCNLIAGPGQILAIRQTIEQDSEGNPILEQYQLEQSGNIIDGDGTWLTELPMNLEYITTNEFGDKVISNDPAIGIPTKSKYRFKIKWQQPATLTLESRRAYFLVPNIKEYGWDTNNIDPNVSLSTTTTQKNKLSSSYYFGLNWSGYTNGFVGQDKINKLNESINGEDTFYEFQFNRVYTVSSLIDQWKKGGRGRFIGIKEIDDDSCSSTINKFPVNDGFRNFDLLFFLFSLIITVVQPTLYVMLIFAHFILFYINIFVKIFCFISNIPLPPLFIRPFLFIRRILPCNRPLVTFRLPMITYPDCGLCDCNQDYQVQPINSEDDSQQNVGGMLTYLSLQSSYITKFEEYFSADTVTGSYYATAFSETIGGLSDPDFRNFISKYKLPISLIRDIPGERIQISSKDLPLGERVNVFNSRKNYFDGANKIKIKVEPDLNVGSDKYHYDNTITVLSNTQFNSGDLITTVNPSRTKDLNYLWPSSLTNNLITGISGTSYTTLSPTSLNITYADTQTTSKSVTYQLPYGSDITQYRYPADLEYFQVVTAITWTDIIKIWNPNKIGSFPNILSSEMQLNLWKRISQLLGLYKNTQRLSLNPLDFFNEINNQYVLILQRGVDPYSPKYVQEYNLGNLFGTNELDSKFTITATTRLNIPIQPNDSASIYVQEYSQSKMYYQSYFFKPGINGSSTSGELFSAYTTTNPSYYGLLDSNTQSIPSFLKQTNKQVISSTSNGFYQSSPSGSNYDLAEDLSGLGAMGSSNYFDFVGMIAPITQSLFGNTYFNSLYYSKTIYENVSYSSMTISDSTKNILRTDRLPSSDQLDGGSWINNPALLQQNLNFIFYPIDTLYGSLSTTNNVLGADQPPPDIVGLPDSVKVFDSFNCQNMVSLECYEGFGSTFQVNQGCLEKDAVVNGCYTFLTKPLTGLPKDIKNVSEWAYRFRFFYGLCRGVLSQSFVNNWVNGSLFAFPIQVNTYYDIQNKPTSVYCKDLIYFESNSNNFYYRSSPWRGNVTSGKFIGKQAPEPDVPINVPLNIRNLLFPTTIMNLGMKDSYFSETSFEPSTRAYVMTELDSSSYGDTSDLVNLFVISRITDEGFLRRLISPLVGNNGLNQLFSRPGLRIDGDLAQLMSINSELGVIKFSPEYYEINPNSTYNPTAILGTSKNPVVAVWFSSTTENLQTKDYLTPGRIDFRATPTSLFSPYLFGIKSQLVPFYQWQKTKGSTIFGDQSNNWATNINNGITAKTYQSLDRMPYSVPTYFQSNTLPNNTDLYNRGYIFSVDANGNYSPVGGSSRFLVGAPFHFYFGIIKGNSALDKFKTKYSVVE